MRYIFILGLTVGLYSCSSPSDENQITIVVKVNNIPSNTLYLVDAYYFLKRLDSARRSGDSFVFHLTVPADFEPQFVSLNYFDASSKTNVLAFRNHILSPTGPTRYAMTSFMLEKGPTYIEGDNLSNNKLDIRAHRETDVCFRTQMMQFGFINTQNKTDREHAIKNLKSFIDDNSFSVYLLQCILNNKDLYSKDELRKIMSLFDNAVQNSKSGNALSGYIAAMTDPGLPFPDIKLLTNDLKKESVIDSRTKLHLLVFWASWCGPCRKEIPDLKKIDSIYRNDGLDVRSIAINDSRDEWLKALDNEKMPWRHFFADSTENEKIKATFLIGAIPVAIYVDRNGKEIKRNIGYDSNSLKTDMAFIREYLHSH